MSASLGQRMVRTAGIFQGLVALPVLIVMGASVFQRLWDNYYYNTKIYDFILAFFNALMAAAIVFIVLVQRQAIRSRDIRLYLEIAKSSCATAVWLWLLFNSIFGPQRGYYYNPPARPRGPRIISAALSVIVLFSIYYPTAVYAILDKNDGGTASDNLEEGDAREENEQAPLLRG